MEGTDDLPLKDISLDGTRPLVSQPNSSNWVSYSPGSVLTFVPIFALEFFGRPVHLWLLGIAILEALLVPSLSLIPDAVPFGLYLVLSLAKKIFEFRQLAQFEKDQNQGSCTSWTSTSFSEIPHTQVKVGQLILLKTGEAAPADGVLLASSEPSRIVHVKNHEVWSEEVKKIAVRTSQEHLANTLDLSKLKGTVAVHPFPKDSQEFKGRIQLLTDYKGHKLTSKNFITRGSVVKGVTYVVFLVTHVASDWPSNRYHSRAPQPKFAAHRDHLVIWLLGVYFLCTLTGFLFFYASNQSASPASLAEVALIYKDIVPVSLLLLLGLLQATQTVYLVWKYAARFRRIDLAAELGQVEYLILTNSALAGKYQVTQCIINGRTYARQIDHEPSSKTVSANKRAEAYECSTPINKADRPFASFQDLAVVLAQEDYERLAKAAALSALCTQQAGKPISNSADEVQLEEFARHLGCSTSYRTTTSCELNWSQEVTHYSILGTCPFSKKSLFSAVIVQKEGGSCTMYVKGNFGALRKCLAVRTDDELRLLSQQERSLPLVSVKPMILAARELTNTERDRFLAQYSTLEHAKFVSKERKVKIFQEFLHSLGVIAILGFSWTVPQGTCRLVKQMKNSGVQVWLASDDRSGNSLLLSSAAGLKQASWVTLFGQSTPNACGVRLARAIEEHITHQDVEPKLENPLNITKNEGQSSEISSMHRPENSLNLREFLSQHSMIRGNLTDSVKTSFNPTTVNDFGVHIDRQFFRQCLQSETTKELLVCLLFAAHTAVFSQFTARDKACLADLLQNCMATKPTVLAVGHSLGDLELLRISNIGVARQEAPSALCADITLRHLEDLDHLMRVDGYWMYARMCKALLLLLHRIVLLTALKLLFLPLSAFSGTDFALECLVLGYTLVFTLPLLICRMLTDKALSVQLLKRHPYMYKLGIFDQQMQPMLTVKTVVLAGLDALVIWSFAYMFAPSVVSDTGHGSNYAFIGFLAVSAATIRTLLEICEGWRTRTLFKVICVAGSLLLSMGYCLLLFCSDLITSELTGIVSDESVLIGLLSILGAVGCSVGCHTVFRHSRLVWPRKEQWKENRLEEYSSNLSSVYVPHQTWSLEEETSFELNPYTLQFKSLFLEQSYSKHSASVHFPLVKRIFIVLAVYAVSSIAYQAIFTTSTTVFALELAIDGIIVLVALSLFTPLKHRHSHQIILLALVLYLIEHFLHELMTDSVSYMVAIGIPTITFIYLDINWLHLAVLNSFHLLTFIITIALVIDEGDPLVTTIVTGELCVSLLGLSLTAAVIGYQLDKGHRMQFALSRSTQFTAQRNNAILKSLLPWFVINRVKQGQYSISEEKGVVTVLFCDIVDFDSLCAHCSPVELIEFLDSVFFKFDQLCELVGVTKIETVGKTYMACAGIPDAETRLDEQVKSLSHATRTVQLALAMIQYASTVRLKTGGWLQLKIGVNTGPVTAGVVGFHKPQFSLVGDTVNTASRMCSTLKEANSVQIAKSTRLHISPDSKWTFVQRTIEAKGKGTLDTFLVLDESRSLAVDHFCFATKESSQLNEVITTAAVPDPELKVQVFEVPCRRSKFEDAYRAYSREKAAASAFVVQIIAIAIYVAFTVFLFMREENFSGEGLRKLIFRGSRVLSNILVLVVFKCLKNIRVYTVLMLGVILVNGIYYAIDFELVEEELELFEQVYLTIFVIFVCNINLTYAIPMCVGIEVVMACFELILEADGNYWFYIHKHLYLVIFTTLQIIGAYRIEKNNVREYYLQQANDKEAQTAQQLLSNMMPSWVLKDLQGDHEISGRFGNVTLLFADIVGFTAYSSEHQPSEVIHMLSLLFTQFDKLCIKYNTFKLYTIGDCYVVMSCTDKSNRDIAQECLNVVEMAIEMVHLIKEVNLEYGSELNMRIGIHTGEVIEGISGSNIVRYDIYGTDVAVANKMESSGEPGRIKISDVSMSLLQENFPGRFHFVYDCVVEMSSVMRAHDSYFLQFAQE